ncbi:MAG: hydrogenase iron-sulfur subunit [Deltaproteobacteria bacterium]|nr:hydrogenase iron-sulfur subunit [Deltaproteobacteria bacterium]MBW2660590.1 hydrogenase iron-sulfur subunit [Deltaproteobacteria bacterium]
MTKQFEPKIIVFCCSYCSYNAADLAGSIRMTYPANIKIILVPCSGRVDPLYMLRALEDGADGVCVTGCMEGDCHFLTGNIKAKKRVEYIRNMLDEMGLEQDRVQMYNISASDAPEFVRVAKMMTEKIRALGPNPIKKI